MGRQPPAHGQQEIQMSNAHHIAGLPEWADDATAAEAAAALGYAPIALVGTAPERNHSASAIRAAYKAVAAYYWVEAGRALHHGNIGAMRQLARGAQQAEQWTDPVVSAVFEPAAPDAAVVARGARISADVAKSARAKVIEELKRPAPKRKAFKPAQPTISRAERQRASAERQAQRAAQEADAKARRDAANAEWLQRAKAMAQDVMNALADNIGGVVVESVDMDSITQSGGFVSVGNWGAVMDDNDRVWALKGHALDAAMRRGIDFAMQYKTEAKA
jgi:hypothetical protein